APPAGTNAAQPGAARPAAAIAQPAQPATPKEGA
ncbi:MAG: hypothetical protein JWP72_1764, partial [Massilia sp.]|nr:hypothetical protein [Massilia sp.]